ncbi:MAG: YggS family pyridoxal phosphate-dependent enzyme [Dysgonamonadaceae bacterium]|jgi:pyridoxal phosphate enzyme (YggS family)|nr:YggS family pyridoxal phosphate-dependent enzyme [Dysgonamonadaceae bacterium]
MNHIAQNINELRLHIPSHVKIIAVSKTKTVPEIREAIKAGQVGFGENKVQELTAKYAQIPEAQWYLIGHLQTNKVKYIAPFVRMIQSVDSFRILEEIDRQANRYSRVIDCLLQIHIAREETKFGFSEEEAIELLNNDELQSLKHVRICGLMGVATFTDDMEVVRKEFQGLSRFFQRIRRDYFPADPSFCELSMGMSDDYRIAVEEGATMVRIGSLIFGARLYGTTTRNS